MRCVVRGFALVLSIVVALARPAIAAEASPDDSLAGLWGARLDFGPAVHGDLELAPSGARWRATIAGRSVTFDAGGDSIRFALPGDLGAFRGSRRGHDIRGFWLQPPDSDAAGPEQGCATPLLLRSSGSDRWRGTVRPLDQHFTLYVKVLRGDQGALVGAFRNPEFNSTGGASLFRVLREGDSVWFAVRPDSSAPFRRYLRGSILRAPDRLRVVWPDLGRAIELTRLDSARAASFLPRAPRDTAYTYRMPPMLGDGWNTARARDVGMDEDTLAQLVRRLIRIDPAARRPPLIHSLLVAHRGKLVLEEYFFGNDRDTPHDTRSAGKTFGTVMLGALMQRGVRVGADTPVYRTLAARGPFANPDPRKDRITLAHLMTHTSGLACDDNDDASPGNEGTVQSQRAQPDWWKYTLDLAVAHDPGTRYAYCSAGSNLVGAVLTTVSGLWLPELFDSTIAAPLGFQRYHWNLMPSGDGYLGGGVSMRPRDLLKIGQLYLDGGRWHGLRLVDSSWVRISTAAHAHISPATTGLDSSQFGNFYGEADEGYGWHLATLRSGGREYRDFAATGNGGQLLIVVPDLDLAVVFTAGNYGQGGVWTRFHSQIVPQEIIPALRR